MDLLINNVFSDNASTQYPSDPDGRETSISDGRFLGFPLVGVDVIPKIQKEPNTNSDVRRNLLSYRLTENEKDADASDVLSYVAKKFEFDISHIDSNLRVVNIGQLNKVAKSLEKIVHDTAWDDPISHRDLLSSSSFCVAVSVNSGKAPKSRKRPLNHRSNDSSVPHKMEKIELPTITANSGSFCPEMEYLSQFCTPNVIADNLSANQQNISSSKENAKDYFFQHEQLDKYNEVKLALIESVSTWERLWSNDDFSFFIEERFALGWSRDSLYYNLPKYCNISIRNIRDLYKEAITKRILDVDNNVLNDLRKGPAAHDFKGEKWTKSHFVDYVKKKFDINDCARLIKEIYRKYFKKFLY